MSITVLKEYENKKIHTLGKSANIYRPIPAIINGDTKPVKPIQESQNYCDTKPVELETIIKEKYIELSNYKININIFYAKLGKGKKIISHEYNRRLSDKTFNETLDMFNNFNLEDYCLNELCQDKKNNEYYTYNNNLEFRLVDYEIEETDTDTYIKSGKLVITFKYFKCPNCGELLMKDYIFAPHRQLQGIYLYDDEEHIKISYCMKEVVSNNQFAWNRYYKNMFIFKKKTRKIYTVEDFNYAGSKYLKNKHKKKVKDVTNACRKLLMNSYFLTNEHLKEGNAIFLDKVRDYLKEEDPKIYEFTKSDVEALKNHFYNEFIYYLNIKKQYNINNTLLAKLIFYAKKANPKTHSIIKNMTEKEIMDYFKVNTKRLKKIESFEYAACYVKIFDLIEDVNNLNLVIEKTVQIPRASAKYKDFYYNFRKNNTEKRFINQIINLSNNRYYIHDTADLFNMIKQKVRNYNIDYSRTLKDIHDILSRDYNKLKHNNEKIKPCKQLVNMFKGVKINDITYKMPSETDQLISIGAFMDICVGGYGKKAVNKECYIVVGYNSEDKPVTCIEFRKEFGDFHLCQVKKRNNYTAKDSEANELIKLFKENGIKISTSDLDENRYKKLEESQSEIIGKRTSFTYAVAVPEELRQELVG